MTDQKQGDGQAASSDGLWDRRSGRLLGGLALLVLLLGTVVYHLLEDWSWVDSLYFCTVAVATVGFGDFVPSTDTSKLFTVVYISSGIAIFSLFIDSRLKRHARRAAERGKQ